MCACDRNYSCPRCTEIEDPGGHLGAAWKREQEEREEARYGHRSPADGPEALGLVFRS